MASVERQIETDLRLLSSEAKGFPVVIDAAERGILKLRAVLPAFHAGEGPVQCVEFVRPFLLACNHSDAGRRMLSVAISGMQRLVMVNAIQSAEPPNILRVLQIQVSCAVVHHHTHTSFHNRRCSSASPGDARPGLLVHMCAPCASGACGTPLLLPTA